MQVIQDLTSRQVNDALYQSAPIFAGGNREFSQECSQNIDRKRQPPPPLPLQVNPGLVHRQLYWSIFLS